MTRTVSGTEFLIISVGITVFYLFYEYMLHRYVRLPSDNIIVIFGNVGNNRLAKFLHNEGAFVMPFYQEFYYLSLSPIETEVYLPKCISKNGDFQISIKTNISFAIGTEEHLLNSAAERLLFLSEDEIKELALNFIKGQLQIAVASFPTERLQKESTELIDAIKTSIDSEINKIGLKIFKIDISELNYCKKDNLLPTKEN